MMKLGKGKKPPAFAKAGPAAGAKAKPGRSAKAPGAAPLAPPGLASKMRGLSPMPRMMRKGGMVSKKGC
jgi:hypothetical protein